MPGYPLRRAKGGERGPGDFRHFEDDAVGRVAWPVWQVHARRSVRFSRQPAMRRLRGSERRLGTGPTNIPEFRQFRNFDQKSLMRSFTCPHDAVHQRLRNINVIYMGAAICACI